MDPYSALSSLVSLLVINVTLIHMKLQCSRCSGCRGVQLLSLLCICFTVSRGNIWEKVSTLPDKIHPDFHAVEDLFSQRVIQQSDAADSAGKKKGPEIVSILNNYRYLQNSCI